MSLVLADRVRETTTSTGTGAITLAGAVSGFQSFLAGIGIGNSCFYGISGGGSWEVGTGTLSGATTLTRGTVLSSSNGNAPVAFAAGVKDVFVTLPASKVVTAGNVVDEWARNNILLLWLENEIQNAVAGGTMQDGTSDAFASDTLGATSTGEYWDSSGKYYSGAVVATSYANAGGSGDRSASITVTSTGFSSGINSNFVDGAISAGSGDGRDTAGAATASVSITFDLGSAKVIDESKFYQSAANTHGTFKWRGSNDNSTYTDIGSSFTLGGATTNTLTSLNGNQTAYRYYKLEGVSGTTSGSPWWEEFEFKISAGGAGGGPAAFTLMSGAFTAEAQPTDARLIILHDPVGSVALNTDIIASVSRDGGTTWTAVPLTDEGDYDASYSILAGTADLTVQPTGTSMKWKIATAAVEQRVRGVAMMWR